MTSSCLETLIDYEIEQDDCDEEVALISSSVIPICETEECNHFAIPNTGQLYSAKKADEIVKTITWRIKSLPKYKNLRNDTDVTLMACHLAEMLVKKKDGIAKKKIVLQAFHNVYKLSPNELVELGARIEFLKMNNQIKKPTCWARFCFKLKRYLFCYR